MLYEDLRSLHEDLERLEAGIATRVLDDPKHIRPRLIRDHEIANLLSRVQSQSERALKIYNERSADLTAEVQAISTGDQFEEFYKQLGEIKDFHQRYPNEPVENLERAYKKSEEGGTNFAGDIDGLFTGEEAFGRFFDLTMLHEEYLNLPGVKGVKKLTYLQYLDVFDKFTPPQSNINRQDKMKEEYFAYVGALAQYLESFIRRVRPLEDVQKLFRDFDEEFEKAWEKDEVPGWEAKSSAKTKGASKGPVTEGTGEGIWCADCEKEFKNDNVYKAHLAGKKHIKNAEARQANPSKTADAATSIPHGQRLKERAVAEREDRIRRLASTMKTEREDTRVNVERKAGMTDRERQQELAALYAEDTAMSGMTSAQHGGDNENGENDEDGDEKIYNPLKLPLAWDGKPIPFWLYKLHGLGVEFPCEICGNYVYMGRRAFDKHFGEARHVYGLKCLGITHNTGLFSQITGIEEAVRLWDKIQRDRKEGEGRKGGEGVEEMEDAEGNVMPRRVWEDLRKAGLL